MPRGMLLDLVPIKKGMTVWKREDGEATLGTVTTRQ